MTIVKFPEADLEAHQAEDVLQAYKDALGEYRDLDGYLAEAVLAAGVCKVAIENEMMDRKEGRQHRLPFSDRKISFLLRDLERRVELLREEFYSVEWTETPDL
jgi:hypothetical protein